jgi:hypothetical protein
MIEDYLIFIGVGIILCILGILMRIGKLNFILSRYESFHKAIRKRNFTVDRDSLSKFYFFEFLILGGLLLIAGIIHAILPENNEFNSYWIYIVIISIGIIGMLYCNFSNRFLNFD